MLREIDMVDRQEAVESVRGRIEEIVSGTIVIVENSKYVTNGLVYGACYVCPELIWRI